MAARSENPTVGFIGIGKMGDGMAKNILKGGYPLVVWDRTTLKYKDHVELGARPASSPKDLTEKSDVIISMLSTASATEEVILGAGGWKGIGVVDGMHRGKIVIDMSTNLPSVVMKLAGNIRKKGGDFVDAPVLGSVKPATDGTLTILAAGRKEVVDSLRPLLETMGKKIYYIGDTGTGCCMKLTVNLHLNIVMGAFAESLAFGAKAGLDPSLIVDIWNNTIFKTYVTETKGKKVLDGDYTPAFTIELALKDMHSAAEMAKQVNAPIPLGSIVKQLYTAAIANGKKDLDFCALVTVYEQLGNFKLSKSSFSSEIAMPREPRNH
jgi:3-hydroxyisobutyrate dehydrogenase-like beta-hydroxyacid dehydrogenase